MVKDLRQWWCSSLCTDDMKGKPAQFAHRAATLSIVLRYGVCCCACCVCCWHAAFLMVINAIVIVIKLLSG
jgi:hypothetical protein